MSSSHPFNPGEHKYALFLPLGGMIILGIITTTLGFVFWPDPKPHYDTSTEGYFYDAGLVEEPRVNAEPEAAFVPDATATSMPAEAPRPDAGERLPERE